MPDLPSCQTGLDVLLRQGFAPLRGRRVGLVSHDAAVDLDLRSAAELFAGAPNLTLATLFGPEHGLRGTAQDLIPVRDGEQPAGGVRLVSLYGDTVESLKPQTEHLAGLDVMVIDLVDVGSRYYTFQATMLHCLEAAAGVVPVVVLDRPNPLGGVVVEGPTIRPGFDSFVGAHPIATRHGMTVGELARLYRAERGLNVDLTVIPCEGWQRPMTFDQTGLPWVLPSPNMPTPDTASVYPGGCLLEGTNLSEGRGTTRPFEMCGAPWVTPTRLCERLRAQGLPGVAFRPAWFRPTFHKFAGRTCGGLQLHVTDREAYQPVRTGLAVLAALRDESPEHFAWRTEPYEFVADRLAIDLLFGSDRERLGLEAGQSARDLACAWEPEEDTFRARRQPHLLY